MEVVEDSKHNPIQLKTFEESMPIKDVSNLNIQIEEIIMNKIKKKSFNYKPIDTYANSIPFGSTCLAMICIIYGFGIANLYPINSLIYAQLLLQSSFGVVLCGYFEYIKGRNALVIMYLFTGFFFFI